MSYNTGLLFNKHYYKDIKFDGGDEDRKKVHKEANEKLFEGKNKEVIRTKFNSALLPLLDSVAPQNAFVAFDLTTTYPGLMIGTGYAHGSGLQGEFKTGFFFDHTTGLPVIPGSSVKGVLRSMFPGMYCEKAKQCKKENKVEDAAFWEKKASNRKSFIEGLLADIGFPDSDDPDFICKLEYEIFEGMYGNNPDRTESKCHFAAKYRDIFFDAIITKGDKGLIFKDEYITPHKNPLENPVPLQLLKIRPDVTFTFQFKLGESYTIEENGESVKHHRLLTADQRLELFRQLLMILGVGAKTNTGFGQFKPDKKAQLQTKAKSVSNEMKVIEPERQSSEFKFIKKDAEGTVIVVADAKTPPNHIAVKLLVAGGSEEIISYYRFPAGRAIGQMAKAKITNVKPELKVFISDWL